MPQVIHASDLVVKLRVSHQMEVVINLLYLSEVLVLHAASSLALGAVLGRIREQNLVDHDVVDVNLLLGKLNRQTLRLVHAEELWDADCHECSLAGILELLVHILNLCLHVIDTIEESLLDILSTLALLVHHSLHLSEHTSKLIFELDQLD